MLTLKGLPVFTKGIWKSVYLVGTPATTAAITSFVPLVKYVGKQEIGKPPLPRICDLTVR